MPVAMTDNKREGMADGQTENGHQSIIIHNKIYGRRGIITIRSIVCSKKRDEVVAQDNCVSSFQKQLTIIVIFSINHSAAFKAAHIHISHQFGKQVVGIRMFRRKSTKK